MELTSKKNKKIKIDILIYLINNMVTKHITLINFIHFFDKDYIHINLLEQHEYGYTKW